MADHGLKKRSSTTSYIFSAPQADSVENSEQLNQSAISQLDELADRRGQKEQQPPPPPYQRSKKKRKKQKKSKDTEGDVELQTYMTEPGMVPTAAVYHVPVLEPEAGASPSGGGSHDWQDEDKMPVAVQKQVEKRGLHRQTSIVTVRLGSLVDPEPSGVEDLNPVESYSTSDRVAFRSRGADEAATKAEDLSNTKASAEEGGVESSGGDINPEDEERDRDMADNTSRSDMEMKAAEDKRVQFVKARNTRVDTTETTLSTEATSKEAKRSSKDSAGAVKKPAVKTGTAAESAAMAGTAATSGGATAQPAREEESEVMCCGLKVDPEKGCGKFLKRHKSLGRCRPAGGPFPAMYRGAGRLCSKLGDVMMERKWLFAVIIIGLLLLMFVILFPISLVRLDYHQIALKRTKSTQKIHRDQVYYAGCYVLGPNTEFVVYPRSVHIEEIKDIHIFTSDRLQLSLDVVVHYFLRPEELGTLNVNYGINYEPILTNIAFSTIKNTFIQYSLNQLLHSRSQVESEIHKVVQQKLGGTCCLSCCTLDNGCHGDRLPYLCEGCDSSESCDQGHHVDVRHFHFGKVTIPDAIYSRLMASVLAQVSAETESLVREKVIIEKESERQVNEIYNQANEITGSAAANASLTASLAKTEGREVTVQNATLYGWNHMTTRLGITSVEEYKLSLFMISNLDEMDNLVMAQDYSEQSNVQG